MLLFKTLGNTSISKIVAALVDSFSDYFVPMPDSVDFWKNHWKKNRVQYDLSIGTFDADDNLVGFMIMGIDERNGKTVAFNAGTGVISKYRGQKLVKQMYDFAIPIFKENRIEELALEVISQNIKAIKAYQSVGFKIDKLYQCFRSSDLTIPTSVEYRVMEVQEPNWTTYQSFTTENYCWEYQISGIKINLAAIKCFELYDKSDNLMAYYIINPINKSIMRFDVKDENSYEVLYHHWHNHFDKVRIMNVQDSKKIKFLQDYKFENNINQFEMIFRVNGTAFANVC